MYTQYIIMTMFYDNILYG